MVDNRDLEHVAPIPPQKRSRVRPIDQRGICAISVSTKHVATGKDKCELVAVSVQFDIVKLYELTYLSNNTSVRNELDVVIIGCNIGVLTPLSAVVGGVAVVGGGEGGVVGVVYGLGVGEGGRG